MSDLQAGRDEILRDLVRAEINLQGLLLKDDIPDREKMEFAIVALGCVIDYVRGDDATN